MIFNCHGCGWRINQRYNNKDIDSKDVGKHLIYEHIPFCSEYCIDLYKRNPILKTCQRQSPDWNENGVNGYWKIERKTNRPKKTKLKQKIKSK
jgi:hypothetical protein